VETVDAFDLKKLHETIKGETARREPSVIVVRRPCVFLLDTVAEPFYIDREQCNGCESCISLGCPALSLQEEKAKINAAICSGCGLCEQLCRFEAIKKAAGKAGESSG